VLQAAATYTGDTHVNTGTLRLGVANALPSGAGTGNVSVDGNLDLAASDQTINGLSGSGIVDRSVAGPTTLQVGANDQTSTFSGVIQNTAGSVALTKIGIGSVTLSGAAANTYDGATQISQGTLVAGKPGALGDPAADTSVASGATLRISGVNIGTEGLNLTGDGVSSAGALQGTGAAIAGGTITLADHTSVGVSAGGDSLSLLTIGETGGAKALTKVGSGTLTLTGASSYSGDTTISAGTLKLGSADALPSGAGKGNVTVNGTLDLNSFSQTVNGLTGSGMVESNAVGSPTFTMGANDQNGSFSGTIVDTAGTLALTKTGIGTLTLSGVGLNTYIGATHVDQGTLVAAKASALGTLAAGTTVAPGATLLLTSANIGAEPLTLSGSGAVAGTGALQATGTSASSGNVTLASDTTIGTSAGSDHLTLTGAIGESASASLTKVGSG
jgi:autotransporter-associated beta strand protein